MEAGGRNISGEVEDLQNDWDPADEERTAAEGREDRDRGWMPHIARDPRARPRIWCDSDPLVGHDRAQPAILLGPSLTTAAAQSGIAALTAPSR